MPANLHLHEDARGKLVEIFKKEGFGQIFYSTSKPGVTRGNHYHTRKVETFCVIEGQAIIRLRNRDTGDVEVHEVDGDKPQTVVMRINWTHNITNTGSTEMKLLVFANEIFNPNDPDTFSEKV